MIPDARSTEPGPFPHDDGRSRPHRRRDLELVHEPPRSRKTEPQAVDRREALLHRLLDVRDPRAAVCGDDLEAGSRASLDPAERDVAYPRVDDDVPRDLGDRRRDEHGVAVGEAEL